MCPFILSLIYNVSLREYVTDVRVLFFFLSEFSSLFLQFYLTFYACCDNVSLNFLFTYTSHIYHKCKKWIQRYDRLQQPPLFVAVVVVFVVVVVAFAVAFAVAVVVIVATIVVVTYDPYMIKCMRQRGYMCK